MNVKCYTINEHALGARECAEDKNSKEIHTFRYVKGGEKEAYPNSGDNL